MTMKYLRYNTEAKPKSKKYRHRFQRASVDFLPKSGAAQPLDTSEFTFGQPLDATTPYVALTS